MTASTGIGDAIRRAIGHDVELPPDDQLGWRRFPCPFCGKPRGAINYGIGIYKCFHAGCGVTLWPDRPADGTHVIARFRLQIAQAVRNARGRFGRWIDLADLWQQAGRTVTEYDVSGQIDDWDADVSGDPDQLDRFVLRALNGDLSNWADGIVRRKRRESLNDDLSWVQAEDRPADYGAAWISWPTLGMRFRHGMTNREIATELGISVSTVNRRIAAEMSDATETYGGTLPNCYEDL
jgi:Winged helix-turn-helix DNA-binding